MNVALAAKPFIISEKNEKILNFYASSEYNKVIANRKTAHKAKNGYFEAILFEWCK